MSPRVSIAFSDTGAMFLSEAHNETYSKGRTKLRSLQYTPILDVT